MNGAQDRRLTNGPVDEDCVVIDRNPASKQCIAVAWKELGDFSPHVRGGLRAPEQVRGPVRAHDRSRSIKRDRTAKPAGRIAWHERSGLRPDIGRGIALEYAHETVLCHQVGISDHYRTRLRPLKNEGAERRRRVKLWLRPRGRAAAESAKDARNR